MRALVTTDAAAPQTSVGDEHACDRCGTGYVVYTQLPVLGCHEPGCGGILRPTDQPTQPSAGVAYRALALVGRTVGNGGQPCR
jgi:hypothetical protein